MTLFENELAVAGTALVELGVSIFLSLVLFAL